MGIRWWAGGEYLRAVGADTGKERMGVEDLLLFLSCVTAQSVRDERVTVPRITRGRPQFFLFAYRFRVRSEVGASLCINAFGMDGADEVNLMGVEETAIAVGNFGHKSRRTLFLVCPIGSEVPALLDRL
jgi:hypothetical protein